MGYCMWAGMNEANRIYHDTEWGIPVHDDRHMFEHLTLECLQCGLSWDLMLKKREIFRKCFDNFNYDRIAAYDEEDIDRINEKQPRWIKTHGDPSGLQHLTMWAGDEKFLCDMIADEDLAIAMIEKANENRLEHALKTLEAGNGKIHQLDGGGDYGTQNGLLISKPMFRSFFKDLYVNFYREIKKNFDVEIFFHSCGGIADLIPELIDVGVTILDPIQRTAAGMDIRMLKNTYGKDLTFHGAIDVQQVLPRYNPQQLSEEVKRVISILGRDGGYVLAPSHNIQFDTSIENVITMYETAQNRKIRP